MPRFYIMEKPAVADNPLSQPRSSIRLVLALSQTLGVIFLCFLTACTTVVPDGGNRVGAYPPRSFSSKEAAITSATNAFAGGSFQELHGADKNVLVLYHYTSGVYSSDAAIYLEDRTQWRLVAYYAPIFNDSIKTFAEGQFVVLKATQKKQILLTLSLAPENQNAKKD